MMTDNTFELYAESLLALTRHQFNKFRQADMIRMSDMSKSPPLEATTPMTELSGHTKGSIASESQVSLNNINQDTQREASAYPIFKSNLYYDTFQRSIMIIIKAQGLYDVADPEFDPDHGDQYDKQLFEERHSFICAALVRQIKEETWSRSLKEMQGPSL